MTFAAVLFALIMVATLAGPQPAQASLIPFFDSVTPAGANFTWTYDVVLGMDQRATGGPAQTINPVPTNAATGDFVTIHDFRGFVSGTCFAPSGWTCQTPTVGFTPSTQSPADDPTITNLTFTRTGDTINGPVADLGDFGAQSAYNGFILGPFTSRGTQMGGIADGTDIDSIGFVPTPVPEPATLLIASSLPSRG